MRDILKGATDQSTVVQFLNADGTPALTVDAGSPGPIGWYRREAGGKVLFNTATLAALTSSHSDGGIESIGGGYYRLDVPDAAWATGADGVLVSCDYPGLIVVGSYHRLVEFDLGATEGVRLRRALLGTAIGTVANGSTDTVIQANGLDPAVTGADQFLGKVLTFDRGTTTAALRGQSTIITDVAVGSPDVSITVEALTTAPSSGDTFSIS